VRLRTRAAHQRTQSSRQLVKIDGLDDVVVGAGVKAPDTILDGVARSQDENGKLAALPPFPPQQLHAVEARQAEIEHDGHEGSRAQCKFRGDAIFHPIRVETALPEPRLERVAEQRIVFNHQNAHVRESTLVSAGRAVLVRVFLSMRGRLPLRGRPRRGRLQDCAPQHADPEHERPRGRPACASDCFIRSATLVAVSMARARFLRCRKLLTTTPAM
jgi:hypothetical protein